MCFVIAFLMVFIGLCLLLGFWPVALILGGIMLFFIAIARYELS